MAGIALAVLGAGCTGTLDPGRGAQSGRPTQPYEIVQAIAANDSVVVAATQAGTALKSTDQGKSWQSGSLAGASIIGLASCPDGSFVGIDAHKKVWFADARGEGWLPLALARPAMPLAVTCDARNRWWVVGSDAVITSSADRGASWTVASQDDDVQFTTVQFVDERHGFVMGEFGHVMATEDGGITWKKLPQIAGDFYPYAAVFRDRNEGWASGIAGRTLHTRDGGRSWSETPNKTGLALYRMFMHDAQPFATGAGGVIAAWEQGAWQARPYSDALPVFLGAAASLGKQRALVIGGPGGLLRVVSVAQKQEAGS